MKFLTTLLISILVFRVSLSGKNYRIKQFRFLCSEIDTTKVRVESCYLKAIRGRLGLVNLVVHYKGLKDAFLTMKMFYRGTSGRYQPYLIDVEFDVCDVGKFSSQNKIWQRIFKVFDDYDPHLRKGCPLTGPLNISMWEFDKEAEKFLPPIIPGGTFMLYFRGHDSKNRTLGIVRNFVEVKPVGTAELIKLG